MRFPAVLITVLTAASLCLADVPSDDNSTNTLSNDPTVLKEIINTQNLTIEKLNAEIKKLKSSVATTRPVSKFPSLAGVWLEDNAEVVISQTNGNFKAVCSYKSESGDVKWVMNGTINVNGQLNGVLQHTHAPKGWVLTQSREGKLSADNDEVDGVATFSNTPHSFTWKRKETVEAAAAKEKAELDALPPEIRNAFGEHTLAVGMTLSQCNKSLGTDGQITGADGPRKNYQWNQWIGKDKLGNPEASVKYTGVIIEGKLASFEKYDAEPFNAGNAGVIPPVGRR